MADMAERLISPISTAEGLHAFPQELVELG